MADQNLSSKQYPDLERSPGKKDNWVEATGGLPSYIERIAKNLHYEKGMSISHAIATAVNTVKRWCKGGTVSSTKGPTKSQNVKPDTKAKACAAVAEWNAKKAKAGTKLGLDRDAYSDHDMVLELSQEIADKGLWPAREDEDQDFDHDSFLLHLAQERETLGIEPEYGEDEMLYMSVFNWDPRDHPRNLLGQFREVLGNLGDGDAIEMPGGTSVRRGMGGFIVDTPDHEHPNGEIFEDVDDAAKKALDVEPTADFDPGKHPRDIKGSGDGETSDGTRYATPGERGDLEYFDSYEEAERFAEGVGGGGIIEIPEGDRKYRVIDERMEIEEFDTKAEAMEKYGAGIEAGEVNLDEPYSPSSADPPSNEEDARAAFLKSYRKDGIGDYTLAASDEQAWEWFTSDSRGGYGELADGDWYYTNKHDSDSFQGVRNPDGSWTATWFDVPDRELEDDYDGSEDYEHTTSAPSLPELLNKIERFEWEWDERFPIPLEDLQRNPDPGVYESEMNKMVTRPAGIRISLDTAVDLKAPRWVYDELIDDGSSPTLPMSVADVLITNYEYGKRKGVYSSPQDFIDQEIANNQDTGITIFSTLDEFDPETSPNWRDDVGVGEAGGIARQIDGGDETLIWATADIVSFLQAWAEAQSDPRMK